jgi:hypothetical protein
LSRVRKSFVYGFALTTFTGMAQSELLEALDEGAVT